MGRRWDCRWGERMALRCKGCGSGEHVKNGFMRGKQRYRCKACGLNFTDTPPRGMPLRVKVEAVLLYLSGLSMNRTAKLLERLLERLKRWRVRLYCADGWDAYAELIPQGRVVVGEEGAPRLGRRPPRPRHRARPSPPAALAGPVPPPHLRGLPGRAHGRGLDRALRPLRGRPRDRRAPIYASLRPSSIHSHQEIYSDDSERLEMGRLKLVIDCYP